MNKKASDFYEKNGYSLKDQGINEFLIPLCLIKDFFVLCREEKYLILGGDIYKKIQDSEFIATYDSWYYEEFNYLESIEIAEIYIDKLTDDDLYVSFILSE